MHHTDLHNTGAAELPHLEHATRHVAGVLTIGLAVAQILRTGVVRADIGCTMHDIEHFRDALHHVMSGHLG